MNRAHRVSPENNINNPSGGSNEHPPGRQHVEHEQSSNALIKKTELQDISIEPEEIPQITLKRNEENAENNNSLFTCRICLEESPSLHANNEHQLKNMLEKLKEENSFPEPKYVITTCKCQGTSGYVHQRCMIKWIDAQYKRTKEKQMKCEICLEEILYEKKTIPYFEFTLRNFEHISPCNIVCFGTIMMVLVAFTILQLQAEVIGLNDVIKLTIFILIAIFIVAFVFSVITIVKETFYKKRKETTKVFSNDEIEITGLMKEKLTHYDRKSTTHRTQASGMRSARTIRSTRNIEGRNEERVNSSQSQRIRQLRSERTIRQNTQENQENQNEGEVIVRSLRVIRNAPASARSIQIRSRERLEE